MTAGDRRAAFRALIEARISDIEADSKMAADATRPVILDQQAMGRLTRQDALQQQAMAKAQQARRLSEKRRLQAALARLDCDEFGWCAECGDEIAPARLRINPTTERCIRCAR